jgi:restriction system protein
VSSPPRAATGRAGVQHQAGAAVARQPTKGPEFVRYFGPLLEALRSLGNSGTPTEVLEKIADDLKLDDAKQNDSGQSRFYNQVHWARFYLTKEGLLDGSE